VLPKNLEIKEAGQQSGVIMPSQKKKQRRKRPIKTKNLESGWSLKPPSELKKMMAEARRATGTPRQQLIFECIRRELPDVVRQILEERQNAAQKAFSIGGETKTK
jgi:hypothetical protein